MSTLRRGLGRLMGKDVAAITRADFVTAIVAIEDQGKPGAAADLRKCARTFCEWCVHRGFAPANVLAGLRQSKTTRAERLASEARRPRALSDHEIIAIWNAADGRGAFGNIIRLLLLTGARRSEIAKLSRVVSFPIASEMLADARTGKNGRHALVGLLRQSVFGRLAGYEDVNDAERLRDALGCWWQGGSWPRGLTKPDGSLRDAVAHGRQEPLCAC